MKISLARASIRVDWRRNLSMIIILSLSGLALAGLIALENGTDVARKRTIYNSQADLWVTKVQIQNYNGRRYEWERPTVEEDGHFIWLHPNVYDVQGMLGRKYYSLAIEEGKRTGFLVTLIDPNPDALAFPKNTPKSLANNLAEPFNVAFPANYAKDLNIKLHDIIPTNNDNEIKVAEIAPAILNGERPVMYMSQETYTLLTGSTTARQDQIMVQLTNPDEALQTKEELEYFLRDKAPNLRIWTTEGYKKYQQEKELEEGESLQIFIYMIAGFGGFIFIITNQLMRTNLFAQIKEFGTLHALGISKFKLAMILMSQGFWLGITSLIICTTLYYGLAYGATYANQLLEMPYYGWVACYSLIMGVAMISGFTSILVLRKIELTSLLR